MHARKYLFLLPQYWDHGQRPICLILLYVRYMDLTCTFWEVLYYLPNPTLVLFLSSLTSTGVTFNGLPLVNQVHFEVPNNALCHTLYYLSRDSSILLSAKVIKYHSQKHFGEEKKLLHLKFQIIEGSQGRNTHLGEEQPKATSSNNYQSKECFIMIPKGQSDVDNSFKISVFLREFGLMSHWLVKLTEKGPK